VSVTGLTEQVTHMVFHQPFVNQICCNTSIC